MANICLSVIKIALIIIIIGAMVIWAILLAQILENWSSNHQQNWNYTRIPRRASTGGKTMVFYITNTCIPELFAIIAVIAVICANKYWCQTCGLILAIFWINDHQRNPQLFYYGSPLTISGHALHLSVWVLLLLFGSFVNIFRMQSKPEVKPSRVVNNLNYHPYTQYADSKYVV